MKIAGEAGGRLAGKSALITGGCSGMGLATARLFVREGATVTIADVQVDRGRALESASRGAIAFVQCDVRREGDIAAAIAFAEGRSGGLDLLFNNAGAVGDPAGVVEISVDGWDRTLSLLLRSAMLGIKHAVPAMRKRGGGSIVNNASIAGLQAGRSALAYSVAKAGVVQLTRMAAGELARDNIRVNTICPGFIITSIYGDLLEETPAVADAMQRHLQAPFERLQPLRRAGSSDDVAEACLFLATDASRFITGTELVIDGGLMVETRLVVDPASGNAFVDVLKRARDDAVESR
ncbi:MAG: SDR family NAD(P)-dependent oxidoreductase [Dehalococcoidia bacterium]